MLDCPTPYGRGRGRPRIRAWRWCGTTASPVGSSYLSLSPSVAHQSPLLAGWPHRAANEGRPLRVRDQTDGSVEDNSPRVGLDRHPAAWPDCAVEGLSAPALCSEGSAPTGPVSVPRWFVALDLVSDEVVADAASTIEIIEIVRARELNAAVVRATREDATSASFLLRRRRTVALRRVGWSTKGANADSWRCEMLPASPVESGTAPKPRQRCSRG